MLPKKEFETVFIGGGTPSLLPAGMIPRLAAKLRENFVFPADAEISIECNPESVSLENSFNIATAESTVFRSDFRVPMTLCLRQSDAFTPPQIFPCI